MNLLFLKTHQLSHCCFSDYIRELCFHYACGGNYIPIWKYQPDEYNPNLYLIGSMECEPQ